MTTSGENRSIWFDSDRLAKLESIALVLRRQTGIKISLSAVVGRAIDDLYLSVCPPQMSNDTSTSQPADVSA